MQSRQLAKVLDPFYTDRKLGAVGPSDLGDVNLSHTLCTRSQQNLPHEVTGFPPGGGPGVAGDPSTTQICGADPTMDSPNALMYFFLF